MSGIPTGKRAIKIALEKNKAIEKRKQLDKYVGYKTQPKTLQSKLQTAYHVVYGDDTVPYTPTADDQTQFRTYWDARRLLELHDKLKPLCEQDAEKGKQRHEAFCYCRDERRRRGTGSA